MLSESGLPRSLWAETAAYRSPVEGMTPLTEKKPDVGRFLAYAHIPKDERKKLDDKAKRCALVGYGTEVKGYRVLSLERCSIVVM